MNTRKWMALLVVVSLLIGIWPSAFARERVPEKTDGENPRASERADAPIDTVRPASLLALGADKAVAVEFVAGSQVDVPMTLVNNSQTPLALDRIDASADGCPYRISTEPWMSLPLEPHGEYHFKYTAEITAPDEDMEWIARTVEVASHDPVSGKAWHTDARAYIAPLVDGPSIVLMEEDFAGIGGDVGDVLRLPLIAMNNGTVDLGVSAIGDACPTDFADYEEDYDSFFAKGDSFRFNFNVEVLPDDVFFCAMNKTHGFNRLITLQGIALNTLEIVSDQDDAQLAFTGELPGLSLTMTQTTPDQPTWMPDSSGHIADIGYDCVAKNTGERSIVLDGLYAHMYPKTDAASLVLDLGGNVTLLPGQEYSFSVTLPITAANITPASASETDDGLVEVEFTVDGLDCGTKARIVSSDSAMNAFEYRVSLNETE